MDTVLNDFEKKNIELIEEVENEVNSTSEEQDSFMPEEEAQTKDGTVAQLDYYGVIITFTPVYKFQTTLVTPKTFCFNRLMMMVCFPCF